MDDQITAVLIQLKELYNTQDLLAQRMYEHPQSKIPTGVIQRQIEAQLDRLNILAAILTGETIPLRKR